jgi:Ca2+-binding EF-hand superfamily protein
MCWNCGCMMPDNDMGNKDNITTEKLRKAAKAGGNKTLQQLMANVIKTYDSKIKGTSDDTKSIK